MKKIIRWLPIVVALVIAVYIGATNWWHTSYALWFVVMSGLSVGIMIGTTGAMFFAHKKQEDPQMADDLQGLLIVVAIITCSLKAWLCEDITTPLSGLIMTEPSGIPRFIGWLIYDAWTFTWIALGAWVYERLRIKEG